MVPEYISVITSALAALTMLTLVVGYGRALFARSGVVFHLVVSICLIYISYVARTQYWVQFVPGSAMWGRNEINPLFDGLAIWGGIHGHMAIFLMIPEEDRSKWTPLTAWLYPPFIIGGTLRRMIRWLFS